MREIFVVEFFMERGGYNLHKENCKEYLRTGSFQGKENGSNLMVIYISEAF